MIEVEGTRVERRRTAVVEIRKHLAGLYRGLVWWASLYGEVFPTLGVVHRTTFARQATKQWKVKLLLWRALLGRIEHDPYLCVVDSFCVPVCSLAKAPRHKSFSADC